MVFSTCFVLSILFLSSPLQPGKIKNGIAILLILGTALLASLLSPYFFLAPVLGWALNALFLAGFSFFYQEERFSHVVLYWAIPYATVLYFQAYPAFLAPICMFSLALYRRETTSPLTYLKLFLLLLLAAPFPIVYPSSLFQNLLVLWVYFTLELLARTYEKGLQRGTEALQQRALLQQSSEIKQMYLDMRSFRHDYHNHTQSALAYLALGKVEEAKRYLATLDENLSHIGSYMQSGNLMADAIVNSKLSIAASAHITIHAQAVLPESLPIRDTDLCVLLGNLLDNAIEACEQIEPKKRFLRLYMVTRQKQLYISVQNAAKEILNFNERHYITSKRGQHGLGLLRVNLLVQKYQGYLNLQNEPGVFAAEVTLPLA